MPGHRLVWDLTPDLENYTIFHYSNSFSRNYGARIVACNPNLLAAAMQTVPRILALRCVRATLVGGGAFIAQPCNQLARQNARGDGPLDIEIDNPNPYHAHQAVAGDQHHDLEGQRQSDRQEYRQLLATIANDGSFSLNGDNLPAPDFRRG